MKRKVIMNAVGDAIGNAGLTVINAGNILVQSVESEERENGKGGKAVFKSAMQTAAGTGLMLLGWAICMVSNAINTTALRFFRLTNTRNLPTSRCR